MSKHLFIAEKPSLAKSIALARGKILQARPTKSTTHWTVAEDVVTWVYGHMYQLVPPETYDVKYKNWSNLSALPIVPKNWQRVVIKGRAPQLKAIKSLLKASQIIVNAGDPGREGQLLIDEVLEEMGVSPFTDKVMRLWVPSLTERDLIQALKTMVPNHQKRDLSVAANLRQRADWMHGMNMTRLYTVLAQNSGSNLLISVGRVQTPTLKLVVDRDREIEGFNAVDHFTPTGLFIHDNGKFYADWIIPEDQAGIDHEGRLIDQQLANKVVAEIIGKAGLIEGFSSEKKSKAPPLPHSLATLQAACSKKFGLTAKQTLAAAQALYENFKVATYPRTDSQYLPVSMLKDDVPQITNALKEITNYQGIVSGVDISLKSAAWNDSKLSDHHAIIPTREVSEQKLNSMSQDQRKVFDLIAKGFIMQFYPPQTWLAKTALIAVGEHKFKATGRESINMGWQAVNGKDNDNPQEKGENESQQDLPKMSIGDSVQVESAEVKSKRTKPPAPFNDGTLIEAMSDVHKFVKDVAVKKRLKENDGIGTSATRAGIIETLLTRNFLQRKGKTKLVSTADGRAIIDVLPKEIVDPGLTAVWEAQLEKISRGEASAEEFNEVLVGRIKHWVKVASKQGSIKLNGVESTALTGTGEICQKCGKGAMVVKTIQQGKSKGKKILVCNNWSKDDPLNSCDHTIWPSTKTKNIDPLPGHGDPCSVCQKGQMITRVVAKGKSKGKKFLSCSNWKKGDATSCNHTVWPQRKRTQIEPIEGHGEPCPVCRTGQMLTRVATTAKSKGKKFLSCSNWQKGNSSSCNHMIWPDSKRGQIESIEGDGDSCPKCGRGILVTRVAKNGKNIGNKFLACNNWRKNDPESCNYIK